MSILAFVFKLGCSLTEHVCVCFFSRHHKLQTRGRSGFWVSGVAFSTLALAIRGAHCQRLHRHLPNIPMLTDTVPLKYVPAWHCFFLSGGGGGGGCDRIKDHSLDSLAVVQLPVELG